MPDPQAGDRRIAYLVAGDARGVRVILVHGTPGTAAGWAGYLLRPPPGTEVVAIDRPGFGRSEPDGAVVDLHAQAQAVAALLPTDGRATVLVGHSLGGPIAAQVAADHPRRVAAVVLLAASLDPDQERIHPMQWVGRWPFVRSLLPRAIRNANEELIELQPQLRAQVASLSRIASPIWIVHGTQDDLVPFANVDYMVQRFTGAPCVEVRPLAGVNHFLPWNSEDIVRETIDAAVRHVCRPIGTR